MLSTEDSVLNLARVGFCPFALEGREALRRQVVVEYGEGLELIDPAKQENNLGDAVAILG